MQSVLKTPGEMGGMAVAEGQAASGNFLYLGIMTPAQGPHKRCGRRASVTSLISVSSTIRHVQHLLPTRYCAP